MRFDAFSTLAAKSLAQTRLLARPPSATNSQSVATGLYRLRSQPPPNTTNGIAASIGFSRAEHDYFLLTRL